MDTIKSLIKDSDGLNFAISTVALIYTIYSSRITSSQEIAQEQHRKLISPIFFLLEPHLFQSIDVFILKEAFNIIDQNKSIMDGKLLEISHYCRENPSQDNYNALCSYINKSYDKSCKRLGLKVRSIQYRLNRQQYKSKVSLCLYLAIFAGRTVLTFGVMFVATVLILNLGIHWFEDVGSQNNQIKVLFFYMIILFALLNQLKKKY